MANWQYRFEEIAAEIEGLESPAEVRAREYQDVLINQYYDMFETISKQGYTPDTIILSQQTWQDILRDAPEPKWYEDV